MPEFDWAIAVGTLAAALLTAIGVKAFTQGGQKSDPADLMMHALEKNTEKMGGVLDTMRGMGGVLGQIEDHTKDTVTLLRDVVKEAQITSARDNASRR